MVNGSKNDIGFRKKEGIDIDINLIETETCQQFDKVLNGVRLHQLFAQFR